MRNFVLVLVTFALLIGAGCASRGEKVLANCKTDYEKVRKCELFAKMYLNPRGPIAQNAGSLCLDVCDKASQQVPNNPFPAFWHGRINLHNGNKKEACNSFKVAYDRGLTSAFLMYCNEDGSPK
ncbi:hypothetical protein [Pseudodesulfovibrio sediminis]|uniref:Lipoprotein n=1 Tax=Pseudodesulfovibrio sediminis TaxID=2810563 RepID=A0ABM9SDN1_9BACT|nr:hypothetical protein [Pseudodesulfovibrio sediminis]BCS87354.1 hypothetical protein PSDVSF_05960 [Pseudodesulfovibrio sediminis]